MPRKFVTLTDTMWERAIARSRWTRNEALIRIRELRDPKKIHVLKRK